jgi:hypothetical protein
MEDQEGEEPREGWKPYLGDKPREGDWRWCRICGVDIGLQSWMDGYWVCGNCFLLEKT